MRTFLVYGLALAAVAMAVVFGLPELLGTGEGESIVRADGRVAPPVVVAAVERTPFADELEALGTVLANESVELTPNRADHVTALFFEGGEDVEAGQLLLELNVAEERALLAEANALRDERRANHARILDLRGREISPQGELDDAIAQLAAAEARVGSLQAAIDDHAVRAPFAGTLGLRRVSVGAWVQPSTVITTLDDLSVVKLDFTIPEPWLAAVRTGMAIHTKSDAWPDELFAGTVATVDTRLDAHTRSATVRALLPNPARMLRPGMLLKVRVDRGEEPVLQVPEAAIVPVGDEHFVFVVDGEGIARRTTVELGRRRVGTVEVLGGLSEGQQVVVRGVVRVQPDAPVDVVRSEDAGS